MLRSACAVAVLGWALAARAEVPGARLLAKVPARQVKVSRVEGKWVVRSECVGGTQELTLDLAQGRLVTHLVTPKHDYAGHFTLLEVERAGGALRLTVKNADAQVPVKPERLKLELDPRAGTTRWTVGPTVGGTGLNGLTFMDADKAAALPRVEPSQAECQAQMAGDAQ